MNRTLFALLLAAALTACGGTSQPFRTEGDPLVQAHLERLLNAERIAYKRTYNGEYLALNASQQGRLQELGEEARRLDADRRSLLLGDRCAAAKLKSLLRENDALYGLDREIDGTYLRMRESDFRTLDIDSRYETFLRQCNSADDVAGETP